MSRPDRPTEATPACNRRDLLWIAAASPLALSLTEAGAQEVVRTQARPPRKRAAFEPSAGRWRTWLIASGADVRPPRPPGNGTARTRREIQELLQLQSQRSDTTNALVEFWDGHGGTAQWLLILLDAIRETSTNPVAASRALALLGTAMADATIATWFWKFRFLRNGPSRLNRQVRSLSSVHEALPSYPSEHAAVAAAAATVLNLLFPSRNALVHGQRMTFDAAANECALSRLWGGANYRSDIEAGLLIGQVVGGAAVQRALTDGSAAVWDSVTQPGRPFGPEFWVPTPPAFAFPPLLPLAGYWNPWVIESAAAFLRPTPPAQQGNFPNAQFLAETQQVFDEGNFVRANPTSDKARIAFFWADGAGTFTPPGHWADELRQKVVASNFSAPRAARAFAHHGAAMADSAIACWHNKFVYWTLRPVTAIRNLVGQPFHDPNWLSPVVTPPFPAYTSGHSTFSGCSADLLEYFFPGGTVVDALGNNIPFQEAAEQARDSRLYGGIHYQSDNQEGLLCGKDIAATVIARAQRDGAPGA